MTAHNTLTTKLVTGEIRKPFQTAERDRVQQLGLDEVRSLRGASQVIRVISGTAWITALGKDIILDTGEYTVLPTNPFPVVLSVLGKKPLVYEMQS